MACVTIIYFFLSKKDPSISKKTLPWTKTTTKKVYTRLLFVNNFYEPILENKKTDLRKYKEQPDNGIVAPN